METKTIDVSALSAQELEELLAKKRKQEQADYNAKKEEFESAGDNIADAYVEEAKAIRECLVDFKTRAINRMLEYREEANIYGGVRKGSKGGYSVRSRKTDNKIALVRDVKSEYDDRAKIAEQLIKEFLADKVKKRDQDSYEFIVSLLEKNAKGGYEPAMIAKLLKQKDRWQDERWQRAMQLFTEAHNTIFKKLNVRFWFKDPLTDEEVDVVLSFSALPVNKEESE